MPTFHRTRLAPTPSGYLHLGNVVSFVITAGLARKYGAKILLRMDDMDHERVRPEYVQDIFDTLAYLNIPWDEGPRSVAEAERNWSQRHRMPLYHEALLQLVDAGQVFACSCSRAELARHSKDGSYPGTCINRHIPLDAPDVSWRMKTPAGAMVRIVDLSEGRQEFTLPASIRHFVVRKRDGDPAYQLTSVVDDLHYGVDLVVRGEDLFDSTLAQAYLAEHLPANAFSNTVFHHHTLMTEPDGRKMSKSAGAGSIKYMRAQGTEPGEVFSQIAHCFGLEGGCASWEALFAWLQY
jgi:glutamyl/glutaminyl-tRNA synthetase